MSRQTIDPILREAVRAELSRLPEQAGAEGGTVRRRWVPVLTSLVVAALVVAVGLLALQGRPITPATTPTPTLKSSRTTSPGVTTPLGTVVLSGASLPATGAGPSAADDTALYVALNPKNDGATWVIERIDARTGAVVRRSLTLNYLYRVAVGPDGVYLSTSVITRFQQIPDTILRLDPTTLRTLATRHFPPSDARGGSVVLTASGSRLIATLGDGHVLALDPKALVTRRSIDLLDAQDLRDGVLLSAPVFSDGRVWVLGADHGKRLVSLNPDTLSRISRSVPLSEEQRGYVIALQGRVYLAGVTLERVNANGSVTELVMLRTGVIQAWSEGSDLLVSDGQAVDKYSLTGVRIATLQLHTDQAQVVAYGPHITWVVGLAGVAPGLSALDSRG